MLEGQQLLWSGTFKAAADMINDQYRFCKLDGSDEVVRCDVAGEPGFVNVDKPRAGQGASFVVQGVTKVIAGAALPPFARVTTDNQGRAVLAAEADVINGVTLDRVAAAGELVTILVYGHAVEFTAVT